MKPQNKANYRGMIKRLFTIALPVFSTLFVVGATALIIVIISGYSIDINKRTVIKTGVLNVETSPSEADITFNGVFYGRSNKAIPNIEIGTYTVTLSKEGYFPITKKIEIQHGLATPVIMPLLRTNAPKEIAKLDATSLIDYNTTGYYVLGTASNIGTTAASATPTPTKVVKKTADPTITYTLTRVSVTKPLFDDPQPALDEKMSITTLATSPITSMSVSPTGKLLYVVLTDKAGTTSVSIIPFKRDTTVNASLTDAKSLTNYVKTKGTTLTWSKDGDYIIIEASEQIISYNIKTGTRVILLEKSELTADNKEPVWDQTQTGIVLIKKTQGTLTNTYEIVDLTYNGNPITSQIPLITLDGQPTHIWSDSDSNIPRYIVSTKSGTYFIGKLYDVKSSDYVVTTANDTVGTLTQTHLTNDFSSIKFSTEELTTEPLHVTTKHYLVFLDSKNTRLMVFIYNKRIADTASILGETTLYENKAGLTAPFTIVNGNYIGTIANNALLAVDPTGENVITLQSDTKTYTLGQNDTALLFTNSAKTLLFRVLR